MYIWQHKSLDILCFDLVFLAKLLEEKKTKWFQDFETFAHTKHINSYFLAQPLTRKH